MLSIQWCAEGEESTAVQISGNSNVPVHRSTCSRGTMLCRSVSSRLDKETHNFMLFLCPENRHQHVGLAFKTRDEHQLSVARARAYLLLTDTCGELALRFIAATVEWRWHPVTHRQMELADMSATDRAKWAQDTPRARWGYKCLLTLHHMVAA